jgi:hypothetical protein
MLGAPATRPRGEVAVCRYRVHVRDPDVVPDPDLVPVV